MTGDCSLEIDQHQSYDGLLLSLPHTFPHLMAGSRSISIACPHRIRLLLASYIYRSKKLTRAHPRLKDRFTVLQSKVKKKFWFEHVVKRDVVEKLQGLFCRYVY